VPQGLDGDEQEEGKVPFERRREREHKRSKGKKKGLKDKDWILKKKELYRQRGKEGVPRDSKFTGRRRKTVF